MADKNKAKSKKFRVVTEGFTTDGRKVSRVWIEQMVKNYDPKKYGARINLEHFKGILPDGPFKAYGDVLSLSHAEGADGKLEMFAELSPTESLLAINKDRQKVYTSIEVDPEFAGTGEAYLVGLAVTDSPASLGCEMLEFSSKAKLNPLADRKTKPGNVFTEATEIDLVFDTEKDDSPSLAEKVKEMFRKIKEGSASEFSAFRIDLEKTLEQVVGEIFTASQSVAAIQASFTELSAKHEALQKDYDAVKAKLSSEPANPRRPPASGTDTTEETDC